MRSILFVCLMLACLAVAYAAEAGFTNYMLALKEPVTQKKINQAKSDIEKMGGKILYEITLGMHGFAVAIPSNTVIAMDQKDYVEFMEQDHTVHAFQD